MVYPHALSDSTAAWWAALLRLDNQITGGFYMDYSAMAAHYDDIMVLGQYYDYPAIAEHLAAVTDVSQVLEVGIGTGLVVEHLLKYRSDYDAVTGVDITSGMLAIARERLQFFPQVDLHEQNVVDLDLGGRAYDLAFSYGGIWYFVPDGDSYAMVSHIRDDQGNARGLERVAAHLAQGGRLLLGIQDPHSGYSRSLGDGTTYTQRLFPLDGGFRKEYLLTEDGAAGAPMVHQVTDYRVYAFQEALDLLSGCGLRAAPGQRRHGSKFLEFAQAQPRMEAIWPLSLPWGSSVPARWAAR
jgi:SAM-dependent methyltransferase